MDTAIPKELAQKCSGTRLGSFCSIPVSVLVHVQVRSMTIKLRTVFVKVLQ